jgi:hypothetical protein
MYPEGGGNPSSVGADDEAMDRIWAVSLQTHTKVSCYYHTCMAIAFSKGKKKRVHISNSKRSQFR